MSERERLHTSLQALLLHGVLTVGVDKRGRCVNVDTPGAENSGHVHTCAIDEHGMESLLPYATLEGYVGSIMVRQSGRLLAMAPH